jgi:hypothetical protein
MPLSAAVCASAVQGVQPLDGCIPQGGHDGIDALFPGKGQGPGHGELILVATHFVNISGIAGVGVLSGARA